MLEAGLRANPKGCRSSVHCARLLRGTPSQLRFRQLCRTKSIQSLVVILSSVRIRGYRITQVCGSVPPVCYNMVPRICHMRTTSLEIMSRVLLRRFSYSLVVTSYCNWHSSGPSSLPPTGSAPFWMPAAYISAWPPAQPVAPYEAQFSTGYQPRTFAIRRDVRRSTPHKR